MLPSVIDNQQHRLADMLNDLLARCAGSPLDIAIAYFAISGYRLVRERLHRMGALRLLIGAEPTACVPTSGRNTCGCCTATAT
jgi:hypothetical protein